MAVPRRGLLAILIVASACADEPQWLEVVRVDPGGRDAVLAVNQEVVVRFSEPLDPLSISEDTLRILDAHGHRVPGELLVSERAVRFRPVPPVTPELADGSFVPGDAYRLEIVGMPSANGIRSRRGRVLRRSLDWRFTVAADADEIGLPTLFLPVGVGGEQLLLDLTVGGAPRITAEDGRMLLHFTLPVLPASVRPEAFAVHRLVSGREPELLEPTGIEVVPAHVERTRSYGCTVAVTLPAVSADDDIYLTFASGADAFRDYLDRELFAPDPLWVRVDVSQLELSAGEVELRDVPGTPVGFEVADGRIVPRVRREAGDGRHGWFRPVRDTVIVAGEPFDRGDGVRIVASDELAFLGVDVPSGVTVSVYAERGLTVRSLGDVRIGGRWVLADTPRPALPWRPVDSPTAVELIEALGTAFVAAGEIVIDGAVRHEGAAGGPAVGFLAAAGVEVHGSVPPGSVFAVEEGRRFAGFVEGATRFIHSPLTPGAPAGVRLEARALTDWIPLPPHLGGTVEVTVDQPAGALEVQVQTAPPHELLPGRPQDDERLLAPPAPLPLRRPLEVRSGSFVRFLLHGRVDGTGSSPALRGFSLRPR